MGRTGDRAWVLSFLAVGVLVCGGLPVALAVASTARGTSTASGSQAKFGPEGAVDGRRFSLEPGSAWKGDQGQKQWWWRIRFPERRRIGSILQVNGDHAFILRNAPERYVWQWSGDGRTWRDLAKTKTVRERRAFRIHRLATAKEVRYLRLHVSEVAGAFPTLREVAFYPETDATIAFGDWIVVVSTRVSSDLPGPGVEFINLARQCKGWENVPAQQVWKGGFDEVFVSGEPRPLCAFLSGNFKDWCEQPRAPWRGVQEVLEKRHLPIWAACGGAQASAILSTVGVDKPWDCPRCRDPKAPKLPVYTHIGHTGEAPCGDYSKNLFERGVYSVGQVAGDPVFAGLPREFKIAESHCGQIEWVPDGWTLIATRGRGGKTKTQCMRVKDRYIYAAQFHMELFDKTPDNSRRIMGNFLSLAKRWGGYNPNGQAVPTPDVLPAAKSAVITIVVIGDSTVCDYPANRTMRGWGQMLPAFLDDDVKVLNLAVSGRSSKSFIREGRWDKALGRKPDYVFIQFGHNDCPGKGDRYTDPDSTYRDYLRKYVDDARKAGATPILVTPMTRRRFDGDGKIKTILRPYAEAMIAVAAEKKVAVIDLHAKSVKLFEGLGDAGSAELSCSPTDRTHFSPKGARMMAKLIVDDLPKAVPSLQPYLK